jgi:hypothetical protein
VPDKLRVFVSHSFEDRDREFVDHVLTLLKQRKFHFDVRTARPAEGGPFPDKIEGHIEWADITFGLFTQKFADETGHPLPPPYVISECSYALGRYRDVERKAVHGIVEKGINHAHLGLPTGNGSEFPVFTREQIIKGDTAFLEHYLTDLYHRYAGQGRGRPHPYRQRYLKKTVEIYRTGLAVFKNTVTMAVSDADSLRKRGNYFDHSIWLPSDRAVFPPFQTMLETPISQRLQKPMFYCRFIKLGKVPSEKPLRLESVSQRDRHIGFRVYMPFEVKSNDLVTYNYAWSMPAVFRSFEEEFSGEEDYDQVALRTNHGEIRDAVFRLKFEREGQHAYSPDLFSKAPFALYSLIPTEDALAAAEPEAVTRVEPESTWEIYEIRQSRLDGAVSIRWRPGSKARFERELGTARKGPRGEGSPAAPEIKEA